MVSQTQEKIEPTNMATTVQGSTCHCEPHSDCHPHFEVLGIFVALFLVALTVVSSGLAWTCWMLKKQGGIHSKQVR